MNGSIFKVGRKALRHVGHAISDKSPIILTSCAVAGVVTTVIFAVTATPKAEEILKEHEKRVEGVTKEEKRRVTIDTALSIGRVYLPTIISGGVTIACIIGADRAHTSKEIALAAAYNLSTKELGEWKEKAKEIIGEKKAIEIEDKIRESHMEQAKSRTDSRYAEPYETGHGHTLCFDEASGRFFRSSPEYIKTCLINMSKRAVLETWVSYDDLYCDLDLPIAKAISCFGITAEHIGDITNFEGGGLFSSMVDENGEPVLVLSLPLFSCAGDSWADRYDHFWN